MAITPCRGADSRSGPGQARGWARQIISLASGCGVGAGRLFCGRWRHTGGACHFWRGPSSPSPLRVAALRPPDLAWRAAPVRLSQVVLIKGHDVSLCRTASPPTPARLAPRHFRKIKRRPSAVSDARSCILPTFSRPSWGYHGSDTVSTTRRTNHRLAITDNHAAHVRPWDCAGQHRRYAHELRRLPTAQQINVQTDRVPETVWRRGRLVLNLP